MKFKEFDNKVAVEQLVFRVKPEKVKEFIELDHQIWTKELESKPGFKGKEVWVSDDKTKILTTVYWRSLEEWKSIDHEVLAETDEKFTKALGQDNFELIRELHKENQYYKVAEYK